MARHFLGQIGSEPAVPLPCDDVRRIGAVDHVHRMNAARHLLANALEYAFGARTLDAHRNARILRLE